MHLCRSQDVSDQHDIIIIGAGLIGLCTADALLERGAKVTVIEARPGPCEGTSFSNSGMIHPSQALSWDSDKLTASALSREALAAGYVTARLAERSQSRLAQKISSFGFPPRTAGCFQLHADFDSARAAQARYQKLGIQTDVRIDPDLTFGLAACFFPNDTSGNARKFGCALADDLARRGVAFKYEAKAQDIRRAQDGFAVSTAKGILHSEHLVVAAGSASPACLARLGVRLNLSSVAGAAMDFTLPEDGTALPACPIMDAQSRSALTVFDSHVRISGGWHVTDPKTLLRRWRDIAPDFVNGLGAPISEWTATRPVSPVGRPYISGTSIPKLWINTGHGHMGWTLCAGSGELLAGLILKEAEDNRFTFAG